VGGTVVLGGWDVMVFSVGVKRAKFAAIDDIISDLRAISPWIVLRVAVESAVALSWRSRRRRKVRISHGSLVRWFSSSWSLSEVVGVARTPSIFFLRPREDERDLVLVGREGEAAGAVRGRERKQAESMSCSDTPMSGPQGRHD
jgi:hypothetical protein